MRLFCTGTAIASISPPARRLASNEHYENQAFAYGRNALALQFHLEADPRQLEEWYVGHTVELAAAEVAVTDLRAATSKFANGLAHQADAVFSRWLYEISQSGDPVESLSRM
jgi:GMP synthase (glutamine-hydrolysing)